MENIPFETFLSAELRAGTILRAERFPEARKPAYKLWVDFGPEIGTKQTSAQITVHYKPEDLVGRQIVGCLNLGVKKIAGFTSEFLCTGFADSAGDIVLTSLERPVANGSKLC